MKNVLPEIFKVELERICAEFMESIQQKIAKVKTVFKIFTAKSVK